MNNLCRKIFALSICLCSALVLFADEIVTVSGAKCQIDTSSKTAVVIGRTSSSTTSVTIPYRVNSSIGFVPLVGIADEAFMNCANLTKLDFDYDHIDDYTAFKRIGERAFMNCTGLVEIGDYLPEDIEEFAAGAFRGCSKLENISFPSALKVVGDSVFARCTSLENAYMNSDLEKIGYKAFHKCSSLTSFYNQSSNLESIGDNAFQECVSMTVARFKSASLKEIASSTFSDCTNLTTVEMPNTVTSIETIAFANCSSLSYITLPNSLKNIAASAFLSSGLESIEIPSSVTNIGTMAFCKCTNLKSVALSQGVTSIDLGAFSDCISLTSIEFPNSLISIESSAFQNCTKLDNITLPKSLKSLGDRAFYGCTSLTNLDTGCTLEIIPLSAFEGCSRIYTLTLGPSIRKISSKSFSDCSNLQTILCYAENAPSVVEDAFANGVLSNVTLRIPTTVLDAYQNSETWKDCKVIYNMLSFGERCAPPVISLVGGKIKAESATPEAQCNITYHVITNPVDASNVLSDMLSNMFATMFAFGGDMEDAFDKLDKTKGYGIGNVTPTLKLKVKAYASAEGHFTSETVNETFDLMDIIGVSGAAGDMDGDGELTVKDVTKLVDKVLKK